MNIKSLAMIGAVSLGFASLGSAQVVYMTGSTAMRAIVYNTLISSSGVFDAAPSFAGRSSTTASGCNYMTFSNTVSGTATVVKCHWSGSEAGIRDVNTATAIDFLSDLVPLDGTASSTAPTGSELVTNAPGTIDIAMADNSKAFSKNTGASSTEYFVGVIPFLWVKASNNLAAASSVTNVTDAQIRKVLEGGQKLALITGNTADTNNFAYVQGRDSDSGTRVNAFGIPQFGIRKAPSQIETDASGNMIDLDPPNLTFSGDFGFSSGGTLATRLGVDTSTKADQVHLGKTGFLTLAYLGISDALAAVKTNATFLAYNGVAYSSNNVVEGQYAFWGNEFAELRTATANQPQAVAVFTKLTNDTTGINAFCDGIGAFNKNTMMRATRTAPINDPIHR